MNNIDLQPFHRRAVSARCHLERILSCDLRHRVNSPTRSPPGGSVGVSFYVITPPIPSACSRKCRKTLSVTASIKAVGRHGGTSIESAPFITRSRCAGLPPDGLHRSGAGGVPLCRLPMPAPSLRQHESLPGDPCLPHGQDKRSSVAASPDGQWRRQRQTSPYVLACSRERRRPPRLHHVHIHNDHIALTTRHHHSERRPTLALLTPPDLSD
jgi:hypothetical protein